MTDFNVADLLLQDYTPQTKQFWKINFPNILGEQVPAFTLSTAGLPKWNFEEHEINYMGKRRYMAGKKTYDPITITLKDPIDTSASKAMMMWMRLIHEETTGINGLPSIYKKRVTIDLLDGLKQVTQRWTLIGAWIQAVDFGEVDYSSGEPIELQATLRFDEAIKEF